MSEDELPALPSRLDPRHAPAGRRAADKTSQRGPDTDSSVVPVTRQSRRASEHRTARVLLRVARGLAAFLAVCLVVGSGMAYAYFNRLSTQAGTGASVADLEGNEAAHGIDREDMDILVIGIDSRVGTDIPEEVPGESLLNTDTMMLIHVPADGRAASVVSFPRDTYVSVPGYGKGKLNSAYPHGYNNAPAGSTEQEKRDAGQALLVQTINQLSGVQIDHFVEVTLQGFKELTNAVGGVEVVLCKATKDHDSGADFDAGPQVLDGDEALSFVRQRKGLPNGDLDRIKRQQYFMGALLRSVLDQGLLDLFNLGKLNGMIDALAGTITYDKDLDPIQLAEQMRDIAAGNVQFHTVPLLPEPFATIPGAGSVLMPVTDAEMKAFFRSLSESDAATPSESATPAPPTGEANVDHDQITIDIYDGSAVSGALKIAEDDLSGKGFNISNTLFASTSDYAITEVQYAEGDEDEAATVAAAIPGSTVVLVSSTPSGKILVVVGANYPGLTSTADPGAEPAAPPPGAPTTEPPLTGDYEGCIN